jgi:hypothetical protein
MAAFFEAMPVQVLNVAGPRNSGAPGIERFVDEVLGTLLLETGVADKRRMLAD